jgi:uncharacterized protein
MSEKIELEPVEARVLGVLIEKDLTTPDQYPLTLNSTTLGANQKSNRDPVLNLLEGEVNQALSKLILKGLAGSVHPIGSRVEKFRHNAQSILQVTTQQLAVLAELMMRGPQQPGELRQRASRMIEIESLQKLDEVLAPLLARGLVVRNLPTPGSRAETFAQTLAPNAHPPVGRAAAPTAAAAPRASAPLPVYAAQMAPPAPAPAVDMTEYETRIADLEFHVARLRRQLDHLAWKLNLKLEN